MYYSLYINTENVLYFLSINGLLFILLMVERMFLFIFFCKMQVSKGLRWKWNSVLREYFTGICNLLRRDKAKMRVAWELTSESLHESFINFHVLVKREQELHESWQARVCMRVSSTLMSWSNKNKSCMRVDKREFTESFINSHVLSNENKSCMRVDKREFTREFHQLSCPGQTRTRVVWELTSESLHESFINSHVLIKREQELHESWQARVYTRISSTLMSWSNKNKSYMTVDKREFTWEFHQLSCPGQTRTRVAWELTSESLHESFINSRVLVKREQELHESWQARVYTRVSSTLMSWSNENKSCMRVDKREVTREFHQLSCPGQTRTRVAWELTSERLHENFINSHVLVKQEQELHDSWQARVYREFHQLSCPVKREQELYESWQARVYMRRFH